MDPYPPSVAPTSPPPPPAEDRTWALLAHLSALSGHVVPFGHLLGPLVIWLVKRDTSPFVADQAKEALNAQLSATIYGAVGVALCFVLIGFPLLVALWVADLVAVILAAVAANQGRAHRYPLILRLVK